MEQNQIEKATVQILCNFPQTQVFTTMLLFLFYLHIFFFTNNIYIVVYILIIIKNNEPNIDISSSYWVQKKHNVPYQLFFLLTFFFATVL